MIVVSYVITVIIGYYLMVIIGRASGHGMSRVGDNRWWWLLIGLTSALIIADFIMIVKPWPYAIALIVGEVIAYLFD